MTVFRPGMRVKKIFHPKLNKLPEVAYVGRITKKALLNCRKTWRTPIESTG